MRGNPLVIVFIIVLFIFISDLYAYRGLSYLFRDWSSKKETILIISFWSVTAFMLLWLTWLILSYKSFDHDRFYYNVTLFFGAVVLIYVPKLFFNIFQFIHDITGFFKNLAFSNPVNKGSLKISRIDFILQLGLFISFIPFFSILWGIWKGKFNFQVRNLVLDFPNLPESFNGIRILQISDIHIGSFRNNPGEIERAVDLINRENADYVLFTGDMVNNKAAEIKDFVPILAKIKAKKGKYSILGNHDYGDYYQWETDEMKAQNLQELCDFHKEMGFVLLRNESVRLYENGESIALIGVENWGLPPFPQYGDIDKALLPVKDIPFKILMSHDPSHWDAEIVGKKNIALTLSGHTHGMQFAIRVPGWSWSPVQMKYRRWGGLYTEKNQKLYVNIGIGFIGFPGRVGTPPEITVFELQKT